MALLAIFSRRMPPSDLWKSNTKEVYEKYLEPWPLDLCLLATGQGSNGSPWVSCPSGVHLLPVLPVQKKVRHCAVLLRSRDITRIYAM